VSGPAVDMSEPASDVSASNMSEVSYDPRSSF
jgi:hypothetical protein